MKEPKLVVTTPTPPPKVVSSLPSSIITCNREVLPPAEVLVVPATTILSSVWTV